MRIRRLSELSAVEHQLLFEWGPDPFGVAHLKLEWRPKELHLVLDLEGHPVSHVGLLCHDVEAGGRTIRLAGLGGVVTVPSAQGHGYASLLVQCAWRLAREEWSVQASVLFCLHRLVPFYERLGWRVLEHPVEIDQSSGRIVAPIPVMVYPSHNAAVVDVPLVLASPPW